MRAARLRPLALWLTILAAALPAFGADGPAIRLLLGKRVPDRLLAVQRGGTDTRSDAALQGTVTGNQAINVTTGGNVITGGAFAGTAGIPVVVQNSGNNVLVQSSVIVNVQMK